MTKEFQVWEFPLVMRGGWVLALQHKPMGLTATEAHMINAVIEDEPLD